VNSDALKSAGFRGARCAIFMARSMGARGFMLVWFGAVAGPGDVDVPTKVRGDGPMTEA
jgi:hypothetical protein